MFGIPTAHPAGKVERLKLASTDIAGPSAVRTYARVQQAQNVTITNGNLNLVAGNSTTNHNHHYHTPAPKVDITFLLRSVRNLRQIQQDNLAKATPGTGIWLLNTPEFVLWLDLEGNLKILWGTGIPGAGKTVLLAIVINKLEARAAADPRICVAYIYFRYTDGADLAVRDVLEILVKQTIERHHDCMMIAEDVYLRHDKEGTRPSEAELFHLLSRFVGLKLATFYFLDALDEASSKIQVDIVKRLAVLDIRLFIVSRPMPAVEALIPDVHRFSITAHDDDLDAHIAQVIGRSQSLQALLAKADPYLKGQIVSSIKEKCGGMFLHASLQLNALSESATVYEAADILQAFPSEIEDVYRVTWGRISKQHNARVAMSVFLWVLYATKPITIDVIERAVATCPTTFAYDARRLMPREMLLTICCGLVTIEDRSRLVRLVHYTAKKPIENLLQKTFPYPQSHLAAVCMAHLTRHGIHNSSITSDRALHLLKGNPLLKYAYDAWDAHARSSLCVPESRSRTASFIMKCSAFAYKGRDGWRSDTFCPLHLLTHFHFPADLVPIDEIGNPNIQTGTYKESPLMVASGSSKEEIGHSLMKPDNILVGPVSGSRMLAFMDSAEDPTGKGNKELVKLLVAHDEIQINQVDRGGRSALIHAARSGREDIMKPLLTHPEIQVNLVDNDGWSALIHAAHYSHEDVAKLLLLRPEIQINLVDTDGRSALVHAAGRCRENVVKLLLARPEIQINMVDKNIVGLLLQHPDIQANHVNKAGQFGLVQAACNGHTAAVFAPLAYPVIWDGVDFGAGHLIRPQIPQSLRLPRSVCELRQA